MFSADSSVLHSSSVVAMITANFIIHHTKACCQNCCVHETTVVDEGR